MSKSVYLVMDMENDLVNAESPNCQAAYLQQLTERKVIENTQRAIAKARAAGVRVGFVRVGFSEDYREVFAGSPIFAGAKKNGLLKLGQWGTEVHPELDRRSEDLDIVKHRVSPFYSTALEAVLRATGVTRIFCSGVSTNAVVQALVRDGHDRDYEIVVIEDACCAPSAEEHDIAVKSFKRFCTLTTSDTVDFG